MRKYIRKFIFWLIDLENIDFDEYKYHPATDKYKEYNHYLMNKIRFKETPIEHQEKTVIWNQNNFGGLPVLKEE